MIQSSQHDTDVSTAKREAGAAIAELRKTVGLPTGQTVQEISAKIGELARDKDALVEWDVRVLGRGDSVGVSCNCHCYA